MYEWRDATRGQRSSRDTWKQLRSAIAVEYDSVAMIVVNFGKDVNSRGAWVRKMRLEAVAGRRDEEMRL